jgi:hypothetical protein
MDRTPAAKFLLYWSARRKAWDLVISRPGKPAFSLSVDSTAEMDSVNVRLVAGELARAIERLLL